MDVNLYPTVAEILMLDLKHCLNLHMRFTDFRINYQTADIYLCFQIGMVLKYGYYNKNE